MCVMCFKRLTVKMMKTETAQKGGIAVVWIILLGRPLVPHGMWRGALLCGIWEKGASGQAGSGEGCVSAMGWRQELLPPRQGGGHTRQRPLAQSP